MLFCRFPITLIDIPIPALRPLSDEDFFTLNDQSGEKVPNIPNLKSHLIMEGLLTDFQAFYILEAVQPLLKAEANCVNVSIPVNSIVEGVSYCR